MERTPSHLEGSTGRRQREFRSQIEDKKEKVRERVKEAENRRKKERAGENGEEKRENEKKVGKKEKEGEKKRRAGCERETEGGILERIQDTHNNKPSRILQYL